MKYVIQTFGCKANAADSHLLEGALQEKGFSPGKSDENEAVTLCIVNSCTVTNEADKQAKKAATTLSKRYPKAQVLVTGCGAEVNPESFLKTPGVHWVMGNQDKPRFPALLEDLLQSVQEVSPGAQALGSVKDYKEILSQHPLDREWASANDSFLSSSFQSGKSTRAFLKIQEGCNAFCSYCIIPYGRGPSRSSEVKKIIEEIRILVSNGVREVVLTGTNIGDYQSSASLSDLIKEILSQTQLERLRLSSLNPLELSSEITDLVRNETRLCSHFHVSLQHLSDRVLKLMKRSYRFSDIEECLHRLASCDRTVFIGMDVITGFPQESEEEFEEMVQRLSSLPWTRLHVFPYSERAGTPATRIKNPVLQHVRVARARRLQALSLERLASSYQALLSTERLTGVLLEHPSPTHFSGYTANYFRVLVRNHPDLRSNQLISVKPWDLIRDSASQDVALIADWIE